MDRREQTSIVVALAVIGAALVGYLLLHESDPRVLGAQASAGNRSGPARPTPEATTADLPSPSPISSPTVVAATPSVRPRGAYAFPIAPVAAATYAPGHEGFPATDIYAPLGSPFVAVTSGVIDEVQRVDEWFPGYAGSDRNVRNGIYIAYIGDDGVRYFGSHLAAIVAGLGPGERIEAGQRIGFVGNSGKAKPGPPYVHFGISHPTHPGDWEVRRGEIDPYPYLQAWQSEVDLKPEL